MSSPPIDAKANATEISRERRIVLLLAAVQFVNVLDFMMVMPLGPDFSRELGIEVSKLGIVGGIYTLAAAVSGIAGSLFLDRFDRKSALIVCMIGLAVGTAFGGFATGLYSLLGARILAGMFGGPATALSLAIVTDLVPVERRGRALGIVMAAFSLASIFGVPAGLNLAEHYGFRAPFFAVAAAIALIAGLAFVSMPSLRKHLGVVRQGPAPRLFTKEAVVSLSTTAVVMLGVFSVVPNISAFVQFNLGFPREQIDTLYLVGGFLSFGGMRATGALVDRIGPLLPLFVGTALHLYALFQGFVFPLGSLPLVVVFSMFMLSGSVRMVPLQSLSTQVPDPRSRARFMSAQSAVQHLASALGAFSSSALLSVGPTLELVGMERIVFVAAGLALVVPFLGMFLQSELRKRTSTSASAPSAPAA